MGRTLRKRRRRKSFFKGTAVGCIIPSHLIQWSLDKGVSLPGMTPKLFYDTGKGLMTAKNIYPPKVIISVPLYVMVTFDNVWNCEVIQSILTSKDCCMQAKDAFILFLLLEKFKGRKSFYYQYIENLPRFYTTPAYVAVDEMNVLPAFILKEVYHQKKTISDIVKRIRNSIQGRNVLPMFSLNETHVRWAWNVINTRSVYFDTKYLKCNSSINVSEVNFALLPLLDLLNHKDTANTYVDFDENRKKFEIITHDFYKSGEQVFINYGPHGNRTLLCEYGFILPDNIHSQVPVPTGLLKKYFDVFEDERQISSSLIQLGINIQNMCITLEGFDWSFINAAHLFANFQKNGSHLSYCSYAESCVGPCIISNASKDILLGMMKDHRNSLDMLVGYSSPILECVKNLLSLEIELMQNVFKEISDQCLLD